MLAEAAAAAAANAEADQADLGADVPAEGGRGGRGSP